MHAQRDVQLGVGHKFAHAKSIAGEIGSRLEDSLGGIADCIQACKNKACYGPPVC